LCPLSCGIEDAETSRFQFDLLAMDAVPVLAATSGVAMAAACPTTTPLFSEIVAAWPAVARALEEWGNIVIDTPEYEAAEQRTNGADAIYYVLIRRYVAEAFANPSWCHVGELAAIQRHEWWGAEGRIGEPTDPWIERALIDLIENLSGVSRTAFDGAASHA
jgi:hypothetical protein